MAIRSSDVFVQQPSNKLHCVTTQKMVIWFLLQKTKISQFSYKYTQKKATQSNKGIYHITIDNTLSWKQHVDTITPKLNKACYIIRRSKLYLSNDALKMVYYAFFHSVMSCGLIFWGNSTKSKCVFNLQKRAIRIIRGARNNDSWIL